MFTKFRLKNIAALVLIKGQGSICSPHFLTLEFVEAGHPAALSGYRHLHIIVFFPYEARKSIAAHLHPVRS